VVSLSDLLSFLEGGGKASEDRKAAAIKVGKILRDGS
jgi:hypothetical protein